MNKKKDSGLERKRPAYKKRRYIPLEQRRQDIVNAASEVFGEKGFHNAKIEDIAIRGTWAAVNSGFPGTGVRLSKSSGLK